MNLQLSSERPNKVRRLADDRIAESSSGGNLVENQGKTCTHDVLWPAKDAASGSRLPPLPRAGPPARVYPFPLDPFQQTAINCLEAGHSVLVAAHTSAGKTVVAEYAFAMALRDKSRVVYTSPLKALSNQKYRELSEEFGDVGLMTGDVTINPNASCLVMTTEILRSMLYRGSEVVREVSLIVYDEVHYLRDKERGVVWEESIILAPKSARFAFLSATLPNAAEFAGWVATTHGSPCHVVYTEYRPTPLQHYLFPAGSDSLLMVVDERGAFLEDNFQKAVAVLSEVAPKSGNKKSVAGVSEKKPTEGKGESSDIFKLVKMIVEREFDPVIVFSFSKKECETLSSNMGSLDLTNDDEKKMTQGIWSNAIECLSHEDQKLGQINNLLPSLMRGIGVHHSGLLPILKEVIEILFSENLIKVLFATETFSTGLNMPAKTVVFTNVRKFDGHVFRWVSPGEYIQMSGRAGRRGKDDKGIVMLMLDTKLEPSVVKDMIKGAPDTLNSAFHLTYNMLLNMMRAEGGDPKTLMAQSFKQCQVHRSLPQLEAKVAAAKEARDELKIEDESLVASYMALLQSLSQLRHQLRSAAQNPNKALPFLQPGRLVRMLTQPHESTTAPLLPDFASPLPSGFDLPTPTPDSKATSSNPPKQVKHEQKGGGSKVGSSSNTTAAAAAAAAATAASINSSAASVIAQVEWGVWGAVVNFERLSKKRDPNAAGGLDLAGNHDEDDDEAGGDGGSRGADSYIVDVLVSTFPASGNGSGASAEMNQAVAEMVARGGVVSSKGTMPQLLPPGSRGATPQVVTFPLTQLDQLSSIRVYLRQELRPLDARQEGMRTVAETLTRVRQTMACVPLLDLRKDMKVKDSAVRKAQSRLEDVEALLAEHPLAAAPDLRERLAELQRKAGLEAAVAAATKEAKAAHELILKDELKARQRVLRRLIYLDSNDVVTQKGRMAAEITSGDELVMTEMIFNGAFSNLGIEQIAAVCSCFVWSEKSQIVQKLPDALKAPLEVLRDAARRVAKVAGECKMADVDADAFVESFRPDLMEAVAAWARGVRFADVQKMTGVFEGSLVRAVRRLEELLRQVKEGLERVGEMDLAQRFEDTRARIKRDIIFAASLYL